MPFNSKIDGFILKVKNPLTLEEENGFNLFTSKGKCATCHFVPLYNGTIPPWFSISGIR
jgi:cytochrome c peroxidase